MLGYSNTIQWTSRSRLPMASLSTARSPIRSGISRVWPARPRRGTSPIRTLALQLRVTPNTVVKAYGELEAAGVVWKRAGAGTYVSEGLSRLADRERERILEQRLDALLAEAHHLNFTTDDVLRMFNERRALMTPVPDGELVRKEKE